ncbi:MAG: AAA family ATPase [Desulfobacteraceae bacterium]|nr:AAA family ATPase [Desulfobacteraceae bacterium]MBU0736440.1 AAA family ATPase [Pseudomonadota bacterium]
MKISMADFFGWGRHPFSDTYQLAKPFLGEKDERILHRATSLLNCGKSFAITGPSGSGKSTLVQHIIHQLDPKFYQAAYIHYGGLQRSGILKAVADYLGVDTSGRNIPLLIKLQKHILQLSSETNARYPVFIVDDAQLLEHESMMDLCSLMVSPQKKTVAASIILVGDETLAKRLRLHVMAPVKTRMTCFFGMEALDENETERFVGYRLEVAKAPGDLFDADTISLMSSHCRGNRRQIMNVGTLLLEEAYFRQEKTIGSHLILECDLIDQSG